MTKIFAHRGASGYAPENTLPAFAMAEKQGADGIELDVQLTKDGKLVVIHDEKIDRTSTGKGFVRDYTLPELRKMSFCNHMELYSGVKIPTLEEVLDLVRAGNMTVNMETKTEKAQMEERVIYSSFNHYSVQKIRSLDNKAETAYLYSDVILDVEKYAADTGVDGLHPAVYHLYMSDFLKRYKASGIKVRVWTVNKESDMKKFIEEDLEAIITNYPDTAVVVRKQVQDAQR